MTGPLCLFCLGLFLLSGYSTALADLPHWDTAAQGGYITSLASDTQGRVWVGTEQQGVWAAGGAGTDNVWTHYGRKEGLGDEDVTALVCDGKGRIWAGQGRHGVSVFNGQAWKNYDAVSGPLGSHVFALAVSPKDGGVWIATENGLARYSQATDSWRYYTRAGGLPADQVQALAFDLKGTLYAGTQCDGLAIGSPADDYASWKHLPGPTRPGTSPSGSGLPDCRINALLAAHDGSVYAGTPSGLAGSQDGGKTWSYLRGSDWLAKAEGRSGPVPDGLAPAEVPTLAEDYVTTLAEDGAGRLWIGHRQRGIEILAPANPGSAPIVPQPNLDNVHSLLATAGPSVLVGGYGSGLTVMPSTDPAAPAWSPRTVSPPLPLSWPSPAAAPTLAELKALTAAVPPAASALKPGAGMFLGDDWQTQGDWVGRYGGQYADLSGIGSSSSAAPGYEAWEHIGPHHLDVNSVYTYIAHLDTPERRFPYAPTLGHRRSAEANDGSWNEGKYPDSYEGPDLWVTFTVPGGTHRASFYFVNADGHDGANRRRDYLLELKADHQAGGAEDAALALTAEDQAPPLAQARVAEFYSGVYKQFLVQGPATFHLKIGRCYSFCTKLQGIFLDRVSDVSPGAVSAAPPHLAYLGVRTATSRADKAALSANSKAALLVLFVQPGSPAEAGNIQIGDILLTAGGKPLPDPDTLNQIVRSLQVGDALTLALKRGAKTLHVSVTLGLQPAGFTQFSPNGQPQPALTVYAPPSLPPPMPTEPDTLKAARALWSALDSAWGRGGTEEIRGRILACRAAWAAQAPPALTANWRWNLHLWSETDHAEFDRAMRDAWGAQNAAVPQATN